MCEFQDDQRWQLVYRASEDGFGYEDFLAKGAGHRNCFTLVKSENGNIFGGFISERWKTNEEFNNDNNAFLFSFKNKMHASIKIVCTSPQTSAILDCDKELIQTYGFNQRLGWNFSDLSLSSNSNTNYFSSSCLSTSYVHPDYPRGSNKASTLLAGSKNFRTLEIEMFCKKE